METPKKSRSRRREDGPKENRNTRIDKKYKVLASLDNDSKNKLQKLAFACNVSPTRLAGEIITMCINHPEMIKWFQKKHHTPDDRRIIPMTENGEVTYLSY